MHLIIRADATTKIGAGHVMRCLAIAQAWHDQGGTVQFASAELDATMADRLRHENILVEKLSCEVATQQDATATLALCEESKAQALVVDGYGFREDYFQSISDQKAFTLAIDDNAELSSYTTDYVLNPNVVACESLYAASDSSENTRLLLGKDFTLLRREFLSQSSIAAEPKLNDATRILVTMGGSDPSNATLKAIQGLMATSNLQFEARVILGGMNRHRAEIAQVIADDQRISVLSDVKNMAVQYAWADVAIAAAGGSNWEMCHMGVPRVLLVIADNQKATAKACEDANTAINLGAAETVEPNQIARAVENLVADDDRREDFRQNATKLIDGLGAKRVVQQLRLFRAHASTHEDELRFRGATMSDAGMLLEWRNDPQTSAASRSTQNIDLDTHKKWLRSCLTSHNRRLFVAELEETPVGTIRLDLAEPIETHAACELSWTVAPSARRRGIGRRMVGAIASKIGLPTKAVTRRSNVASQKVAMSAGFTLSEENDEWLTYLLEPNTTKVG